MPYPHVIRLRGPWRYEALDRDVDCQSLAPPGATGQIRLPADWGDILGAGFLGRVRFGRAFNQPSGLSPAERVWLVVAGADATATVELNGRHIGNVPGYALGLRRDVTELLRPHNQLVVDVSRHRSDSARHPTVATRPGREHLPGGLVGGVWLEIRGPAHIEGLAVWTQVDGSAATLRIRGLACAESLETDLSLLAQGPAGELLFASLQAGEAFELSTDASSLPLWTRGATNALAPVEIKLLSGGAAVWQTVVPLARVEHAATDLAELESRLGIGPEPDYLTLPADSQTLDDLAKFVRDPSRPVACLGLRRIMAPDAYALLDAVGVCVLQSVPAEWEAEVCADLARHPCIIGWRGGRRDSREEIRYGRPWV